jgi:hypothetical protein
VDAPIKGTDEEDSMIDPGVDACKKPGAEPERLKSPVLSGPKPRKGTLRAAKDMSLMMRLERKMLLNGEIWS